MRKNYIPSNENEEERLEKIKDVLKDAKDADGVSDDDISDDEDEDEDYDMEDLNDTAESHNTENIQKKSSQNLNSSGSNLMLSFVGVGLAKARKVPAWYTDEFVKQYVEYGSQTMSILGLDLTDSLGTMKKLPTWQKYLIFAVISALTAYFVIPIPSTPNDQHTSIPQPSMQYPTRSQNRYQQQYVIPPNIAIMQGMDGVVTTTSQTPSKSKDSKNSESINENTANMHSKTSETISHTKDSKNLEMSLTDDQQSSESPSNSKDLKNSELQQNIEDGNQ